MIKFADGSKEKVVCITVNVDEEGDACIRANDELVAWFSKDDGKLHICFHEGDYGFSKDCGDRIEVVLT